MSGSTLALAEDFGRFIDQVGLPDSLLPKTSVSLAVVLLGFRGVSRSSYL